jgi:hypothetical protein
MSMPAERDPDSAAIVPAIAGAEGSAGSASAVATEVASEVAPEVTPEVTPAALPLDATGGYLKIVLPLTAPPGSRGAHFGGARAVPAAVLSALAASAAVVLAGVRAAGGVLRAILSAAWGVGAGSGAQPRRRWIVAGLLLLVGAALVGVGYVGVPYLKPPLVAAGFCESLRTHSYDAAYAQLSAALRGRYSAPVFAQAARALDDGEGAIQRCIANPLLGTYTLGGESAAAIGATAAVTVTLERARYGNLSGVVHLAQADDGAWQIDALDVSLLGMPLDAAVAANAYCATLESSAYGQAYALLSDTAQSERSLADFTQQAQYSELIDGTVAACGLARVERGATDQVAHVWLKVMRQRTGEHEGELWIALRDGAWRIVPVDTSVPGSDLGPLLAGLRFCADLEQSDFPDAYALFADSYQQQIALRQFADDFRPDAGARWSGCAPDFSEYNVAADQASFPLALTALFADATRQVETATLRFVRQQNAWRIAEIGFR